MTRIIQQTGNAILIIVSFVLVLIFCISVFKNIEYPLLWNDEGETAMFANRILQYGFPKVDDGKNIVYALELHDKSIGIHKKTGAYIGTTWGQFYFAAIGAFFASMTGNIYLKTMFMRLPFAIIGCAGLILMAVTLCKSINGNRTKQLLSLSLFTFIEVLSVFLALHMREARYYSIAIFLYAAAFYFYSTFRILERRAFRSYALWMSVVLFLLYNSFAPAYFIMVLTILIYEFFLYLKTANLKESIKAALPLCITACFVVPLIFFFKTNIISAEFSRMFPMASSAMLGRMFNILIYFETYESFDAIAAAKIFSIIVLLFCRKKHRLNESIVRMFKVSNLFTLFVIIYLLVIIRLPVNVLYVRYFIMLQPIIAATLILDLFITYEGIISMPGSTGMKRTFTILSAGIIGFIFVFNIPQKAGAIKGHIYELSHKYKGPLDYAIPFIQSKYQDPGQLVIATNYEEYLYMYYLGSKTIVGYVGNNLEKDLKMVPDIIIPRPNGMYTGNAIRQLLSSNKYYNNILPARNYFCNNIPEPKLHQFRTEDPSNKRECLSIFTDR